MSFNRWIHKQTAVHPSEGCQEAPPGSRRVHMGIAGPLHPVLYKSARVYWVLSWVRVLLAPGAAQAEWGQQHSSQMGEWKEHYMTSDTLRNPSLGLGWIWNTQWPCRHFTFLLEPRTEGRKAVLQLNPGLMCDPGQVLSTLEAQGDGGGEEGQLCLNLTLTLTSNP